MKILLIGKDGQVGWELQRSLSSLGELVSLGRTQVDLLDINAIRNCVRLYCPDFIVNAAAYTAVDKAEVEPERARLINELAVKVLAEEAARCDSWFVHYSTDYIFDGKKTTAYLETDIALPLSVYGQTKLNGEQAIRKSGCKHLIFRSSWVYSVHRTNFPLAILQRATECEQIDVISDCFGVPTSASLIADITSHVLYRIKWDTLLSSSVSGIYNLAASGRTSWYEYAIFIVRLAIRYGIPVKAVPNKIFPVCSEMHPSTAKRPKNSQLDNKKISDQFGIVLPEWEIHVERFINEIIKMKKL